MDLVENFIDMNLLGVPADALASGFVLDESVMDVVLKYICEGVEQLEVLFESVEGKMEKQFKGLRGMEISKAEVAAVARNAEKEALKLVAKAAKDVKEKGSFGAIKQAITNPGKILRVIRGAEDTMEKIEREEMEEESTIMGSMTIINFRKGKILKQARDIILRILGDEGKRITALIGIAIYLIGYAAAIAVGFTGFVAGLGGATLAITAAILYKLLAAFGKWMGGLGQSWS